uniref:Uncharacterized protein n=1 Tax=Dulem virus 36 TaxID=3145754 RepID=A0AAU8AYG5_9CAUD
MYDCRPSEVMNICDEYTAFCFDEACCYILSKLRDKEKPHYRKFDNNKGGQKLEYHSFKDFYKNYGGK